MAQKHHPKPHSSVRHVVKAILDTGEWEYHGLDSNDHGLLLHTATGNTVGYPTHRCSDKNAFRNVLRTAERIMGRKILTLGNRKKSRKAPQSSGFSIEAARRDSRDNLTWQARIDELWLQRREHIDRVASLAQHPSFNSAEQAKSSIARIRAIEAELNRESQRVTPFDLADLSRLDAAV
ncbi:hypothetical protein GCM10022234_00780 [Aeromicrobium panaciterrae]|uniref:hypothetical protein n=1 Tax=Aeromicrobium panaciterrae TaxID=363861 RepID=UPI0031D3D8BF